MLQTYSEANYEASGWFGEVYKHLADCNIGDDLALLTRATDGRKAVNFVSLPGTGIDTNNCNLSRKHVLHTRVFIQVLV